MDTPTESAILYTEHALQQHLGYRFADAKLLAQALRHRSYASQHNERLEHLGDSVLGLVISQYLYRHFPAANEGELTTMRSALVRRESLVEIARLLDLGRYLRIGTSIRSSRILSDSVLADTLEAVCGAIYLDGGFDAAEAVILRLFAGPLAHTSPSRAKDPKSLLQERMQQDDLGLPEYRMTGRKGPDHRPQFEVECVLPTLNERTQATGPSRRVAEQCAAARLLAKLADA